MTNNYQIDSVLFSDTGPAMADIYELEDIKSIRSFNIDVYTN